MRWFWIGLLVLTAGMAARPAISSELRVLSTPTLETTLEALAPEFERSSHHQLRMRFDAAAVLKRAIDGGEEFDVVFLLPSIIEELARTGRIGDGLRADIARALIGVAIKAGAPKPALATVEDVRRTVLAAARVATSPDSNASAGFMRLLARLGIAEQVQPRLVPVSGRSPVAAVASGEADLTVITVPNIVGVPGVDLGGVLPAELQTPTTFTVGIASDPRERGTALAFVRLLVSPTGAATMRAKGLEPLPPSGPFAQIP